MPSDYVCLNVGGVLFETTRGTLRQSGFFRALLDEAWQSTGTAFVDRDGRLFEHVLHYLRSRSLPCKSQLISLRHLLLQEAIYFDIGDLVAELSGLTPFGALKPEDRELRRKEEACAAFFRASARDMRGLDWERELLLPLFDQDLEVRSARELEVPLLFPQDASPQACRTQQAFKLALDDFTGGLLADLSSIPGVLLAGGAVQAALTGTSANDVDIFLCCPVEEAEAQFMRLLQVVKARDRRDLEAAPDPLDLYRRNLLTRSKCAVTIYSTARRNGGGNGYPALQVMLHTFTSPLEVLVNFDVDACCVAYEPSKDVTYTTLRGLRALRYRTNLLCSDLYGSSYEVRLEKYARRGYSVGVPGLQEHLLDPSLMKGFYFHDLAFDRLFRVSLKRSQEQASAQQLKYRRYEMKRYGTTAAVPPQCVQQDERTISLRRTTSRAGELITGFTRLLIMDAADRQVLDLTVVRDSFFWERLTPHGKREVCVPRALCLQGKEFEFLSSSDFCPTDSGGMSRKLQHVLDYVAQQARCLSGPDSKSWSEGVLQCTNSGVFSNSYKVAQHNIRLNAAERLATCCPLNVFYATTPTIALETDLGFVGHAKMEEILGGQTPLSDELFEEKYGLPRRLRFVKRSTIRTRPLFPVAPVDDYFTRHYR